jgi:hypothetical protein
MTDATMKQPTDFRIGSVYGRTCLVFARNLMKFSIVTAIATLPWLLLPGIPDPSTPFIDLHLPPFAQVLILVLSVVFSQAIVILGAVQDLRGWPVNLSNGLRVILRHFFPLVGLAFCGGLLLIALAPSAIALSVSPHSSGANAWLLFLIAGVAIFLMWSVAMPVCVVEGLNPFPSLRRSRTLTKSHRLKILVLILLSIVTGMIMMLAMRAVVGITLAFGSAVALRPALSVAAPLTWIAIWTAFLGVLLAVTYHDLRLAKEGVYTDQIATIFD